MKIIIDKAKKELTILAVVTLVLISSILPIPAVSIGCHDITFVGHTYDPTTCYSTWTYNITSSSAPALSHWIIEWCNESAIRGASESYEYGADPKTGTTGIKFDTEYDDGENRIVSFTLQGCGDYYEKDIYVSTKAGKVINHGWIAGPRGFEEDPCAPIPELPTIVLFSIGLVVLMGYALVRGKSR